VLDRKSDWSVWLIYALFLALALHSECWLAIVTGHPAGADFQIYYDAYTRAKAGDNPYLPYDIGSSFIYHPFALTLISCFSPAGRAILPVWTAASAAAWGLSISLALRLVRLRGYACSQGWLEALTVLIFWTFAPAWETLHIGQVNAFVVLLLCLCLYACERRKDLVAGLLLGLASVLKTSPLVFVLYFLVLRRWKAVASTLGTVLFCSIIPAFQFYPQIVGDFLSILPRLASEIHPTSYNQSILSILCRALPGRLEVDSPFLSGYRRFALGTTAALLTTGLWIPPEAYNLRLWLFVSLLTMMLLSQPLVWYHHSTLFLLPLVSLLNQRSRRRSLAGLASVILIQTERLFEHLITPVAFPVALAQVVVAAVVVTTYLREWFKAWWRMGQDKVAREIDGKHISNER